MCPPLQSAKRLPMDPRIAAEMLGRGCIDGPVITGEQRAA
jgi:hypothetical protein